jgi:hypothetical protein
LSLSRLLTRSSGLRGRCLSAIVASSVVSRIVIVIRIVVVTTQVRVVQSIDRFLLVTRTAVTQKDQ